jgi:hypothetical protein
MIAEGIRMKIALVFIVLILFLLPVLPFAVAGDGVTLKSKVQSFLAYSLGSVSFFLSLLTVFLSCAALCNEISTKQIMMVITKPIPRWHFFAGKWLGIVLLNTAMLIVAGMVIVGFTWYLQGQSTDVPDDRKALETEVLTARHGANLKRPDFEKALDAWERRMREEGRFEQMGGHSIEQMRRSQLRSYESSWRSLYPGEVQEYVFTGLLVDPEAEGYLHLRFKPVSPSGAADVIVRLGWQAGNLEKTNTLTQQRTSEFITERFHTIPIPKYAVEKDGTLRIRIANLDPKEHVQFEGADGIELLYQVGTFHWNVFRGLSIIWCRLAFLAAVGLLLSSFLSFPVACIGCFLVLLVGTASGFLGDAMQWVNPVSAAADDPLWIFGPLFRMFGSVFVWLVPDFSKFDPVDNIIAGRVVTMKWMIVSFLELVVFKGLLLGVIGSVIFTKREMARVVV